jgi:hypothetical protein
MPVVRSIILYKVFNDGAMTGFIPTKVRGSPSGRYLDRHLAQTSGL